MYKEDKKRSFHLNIEKCGTCEYWIGERTITQNGVGNDIVTTTMKKYGCRCANSRFYGANRKCDMKCQYYKAWEKTKDHLLLNIDD